MTSLAWAHLFVLGMPVPPAAMWDLRLFFCVVPLNLDFMTPQLKTKGDIVDCFIAGDPIVYELVIRDYYDYVLSHVNEYVRDKKTAFIIVGLVFAQLWARRKNLQRGTSMLAHINQQIDKTLGPKTMLFY